MNIGDYVRLVNEYPKGKSIHLNLSSNFQIALGIKHKDFCDSMISTRKFTYQRYAPEYIPQNSYLLWHEGAMELRVMDCPTWELDRVFNEKTIKNFKITIQTNTDEETYSKEKSRAIQIKKNMLLYLIDFAQNKKIPLAIPTIYSNPPFEQNSVLWLPR